MQGIVLMTVPGRKSGTPRTEPLVYFTQGEERDRLFALSKRLYAGYGLYQNLAQERTIPVPALTPRQ